MKLRLRINGKMLLYILGTTIVVYVSALGYAAFKLRSNSYNNARQILEAKTIEISNDAQKKLNGFMEAASVLEQTFSNFEHFPDQNRRALFSSILFDILDKNPGYLSAWSIWEPNVLDNLDGQYLDNEEGDMLGNFRAVYYRQGDSILSNTYTTNDSLKLFNDIIYRQLKNTRMPAVSEPHYFSCNQNTKELQINVVVPILKGTTFFGVVGIDAPMTYIQQSFSNKKPMEAGKVFLITNTGQFLAHPEPSFFDKPFHDYAPEIEKEFGVMQFIHEGKENEFIAKEPISGNESLFLFKPISIGKTVTPWSLCVSVPLDTIYQSANKTFRFALIIGFFGLIVISLVILGIALSISNPIIKTTKVLQEISRGNIRNVEMLKFIINDEINDMASAMNKLVEGLNSSALFAQQIGEGYLNVDYKLLSENDALGISLISMQKSLMEAKKAEEAKHGEDEKRNWVTHGLAKFGEIIRQHNDNMDKFTLNIAQNVADYVEVAQVAVYINQQIENEDSDKETFELKAAIAYGKPIMLKKTFIQGQELLGRVASENKTIYLEDLPERYVILSPGMQDKKRPNNLLIVPLSINNSSLGIIEMLSYDKFEAHQIDFIEKLCENIASVVASVKTNIRTENLLEQSQHQADELAQHEEEMRQNLEEMEATQEEANKRQDELNTYLKAVKGSVMTAELDAKGRIIDISPAMSLVYGTNNENMRGKYYEAFIAHNKEKQHEYSEFWEKLMSSGFGKRKQKIVQRNKEIWLLESYLVIEKEGLTPRVIVVVIDKTIEKELNDVLNNELKANNIV